MAALPTLQVQEAVQRFPDGMRDQDASGLRQGGEPASLLHGRPGQDEVRSAIHHDQTAGDPDAGRFGSTIQVPVKVESRADGPFRIVAVSAAGTESRYHGIADMAIQVAAIGPHGALDPADRTRCQPVHLLRVQVGGTRIGQGDAEDRGDPQFRRGGRQACGNGVSGSG